MDTLCIKRGTLLDNKEARSLIHGEGSHSMWSKQAEGKGGWACVQRSECMSVGCAVSRGTLTP